MKNTLKGYIAGLLTAALLAGGAVFAANSVRIVIDNKELIPTDVNGNRVDPIIIDGTTYLPVRAVANAFGKAVYWDGPNSTVYLGDMDGALEYPTAYLTDMRNIGDYVGTLNGDMHKDNYGNYYTDGIASDAPATFETLLNGKYSRFKGTIYVSEYYSVDDAMSITIEADGYRIYTSPPMSKTSRPEYIDIDISGYNDFKIIFDGDYGGSGYRYEMQALCLGDAGFYQ